jgi:hypothetical protein
MKALCKSVEYRAGSYELTQGVKGGSAGKSIGGKFFRSRGYGWGEHIEKSKLILHVIVLKERFEIWVDYFFKDNLGRLTEKRRVLIEQTMPKTVEVEEAEGQKGTKYYEVSEADLEAWLTRCQDRANIKKAAASIPSKAKKALLKKNAEARAERQMVAIELGLPKNATIKAIQEAQARYSRERFASFLGLSKDATDEMIQEAEKAYEEHTKKLGEERKVREQKELEEKRKNAMHLWFVKRINPKHGHEQWQAEFEGRLHVLRREDTYDSTENLVPIEEVCEIGHNIVLVKRI